MELCALRTPQILSPLNDFHQLLICGPQSLVPFRPHASHVHGGRRSTLLPI
ncbi:unnamed protein product [Musa acuminata subsp. burmannicoides]